MPVSVLINSLYRQIIFQDDIPFKLALPGNRELQMPCPPTEVDAMLEHSYAQFVAGEGMLFDDAFEELKRGLA
ncbi:MAG: type II toxin-antitoxin system antitoxin, RelB/DinJ family [Atopobiaceae bacterium]|nr:type II toxin-antitoxin system antitoxin, RelB/DinJ family [Atopobiaceae bacterium]